MTDKEIFERAYNKAYPNANNNIDSIIPKYLQQSLSQGTINTSISLIINAIIFNHSFLKAFFGEEEIGNIEFTKKNERQSEYSETLLAWQYHGQQMVLEKNRLKYLERFL